MTLKLAIISSSLFIVIFLAAAIFIAPLRGSLFVLASRSLAEGSTDVTRDIAYGQLGRHKLDHFHPNANSENEGEKKKPIIIFYYGGGWTSGDKATYHFVGSAFANRGYEVVIPNYRLYPDVQFPKFVEDAALAYKWVWQNLAKANNRPIVVIGHSAGAHIAAHLAYNNQYLASQKNKEGDLPQNPAALIGLAGPYAFDPTTWPTTKHIFSNVKDADQARPIHFASKSSPPTLLFHGEKDTVVRLWNQQDLTKALKENNVPVEANLIPEIGHIRIVLNLGLPLKNKSYLLNKITQFIDKHAK